MSDFPDATVHGAGDDERSGGPPRFLGRYRVIAELGRGSTSIVYLGAVDGPAGYTKLFALKLLRPALAEDPAMVALFLMEARIGAQFNHPNVVSTLEIEENEARPFIVMEFLDGKPLQEVITAARIAFTPLPLHVHLSALSGALEGLGHAHTAVGPGHEPLGIVHRDVSPHNVFVTVSGTAKVLDFGFAQTAHSPNTMLTSAARVAYMSPEQATGTVVDARSDLFSIGVMMWEAVTRRRFWPEEASKTDILRALRSGELPPNRESALARASVELRLMVLRATSLDPNDRHESASEFQEDLRVTLGQVTPPTFALRDLGKRVATLFAADRERLQRAIEEHALSEDEAPTPRSAPPTPRSRPPESGGPRVASTPPPPRASMPPASTPRPPPASTPRPPPVSSPPLPAPESQANAPWHRNRQTLAAAALGLVIVSMLTIAGLRSNSRGPAPPATAASIAAPPETTATQGSVETTGPAVEATVPAVNTAPPAAAPSQPAAPLQAPAATATPVATMHLPSHPAHAPNPISPRPSTPLPVEPARAPEPADPLSLPVMGTHPAPARPARPIDSSNPYGQ